MAYSRNVHLPAFKVQKLQELLTSLFHLTLENQTEGGKYCVGIRGQCLSTFEIPGPKICCYLTKAFRIF